MTEPAPRRLRILEATHLLAPEADEVFDRLTRLAADITGARTALLTVIDERRQFFKSSFGLPEPWATRREAPLARSFCEQVVRGNRPLIVEDARLLPAPLAVHELDAVAYLGVPLVVDGLAVGAFGVVDDEPRVWSDAQRRQLEDLAAGIASILQLRLTAWLADSRYAATESIVENLGDACLALDTTRRFVVANRVAREIFPGAEVGQPVPEAWITHLRAQRPDGSPLPAEEGPLARGLAGADTDGQLVSVRSSSGAAPTWVEICGRPVRDPAGTVVAAVAIYRDVTERQRQAVRDADLRRADQLYRAIVQHLPGGAVFVVDRELRYVSAEGPLLPEMLQRADLGALVGRKAADVVLPSNRDAVLNAYAAAFQGEQRRNELERAGRFYDMRTVPIYDGPDITHVLVASFDVTERRREAEALRQARDALVNEHALLETMIAHIDDGVALLDAERRVLLANDRYCEMLGIDRVSARGMSRDEFLGRLVPLLADPETFRAEFAATPATPINQEFTFARPQRRVMRRSWTPLRPEQGGGFLVTWHDVTAAHDLLRERERQLLIDPLTGIANRRAADLSMRTEHERMKRTGTPMSVALFDVDHFKHVNDRFGHATGDQVLCVVAATLKAQARLTDTVARWGGEEFLAVLNVPLDSAKAFCERVRRTVELLDHPGVGRLTISAGVAELSPHEAIAAALARADHNLYEAKALGRNRVSG